MTWGLTLRLSWQKISLRCSVNYVCSQTMASRYFIFLYHLTVVHNTVKRQADEIESIILLQRDRLCTIGSNEIELAWLSEFTPRLVPASEVRGLIDDGLGRDDCTQALGL